MKTLEEFQEDGARFLARERKAFLGDEAGLGKTLQAIRACDHIGARKVLAIVPPSVVVNWRREFADSSLLDPQLDITTPTLAARAKLETAYDAVILDEGHYYKTPTSARTKTVYGERCEGEGLVSLAPHTFVLSGSPVPNNPSEIWTHLHALRPELIPGPAGTGPLSFTRFQQVYCQIQQTPFGPRITGVRPSRVPALKELLSHFMLRRFEDSIALPPLRIEPLYVDATISRIDNSEDAKKVRDALAADGLAGLKKLTGHVAELRRLLGLAKVEPVINYVRDWLMNNDGKICIYAHHREVIECFQRTFRDQCASITGSTTNRQAEVDRLQTDPMCRVFIGQEQAAGEAITLTKASETLLVEPSWVPKDNYQVIKRIHRYGQEQPCLARFVTIEGSIDDKINQVLMRKEAMISAVFGEAA